MHRTKHRLCPLCEASCGLLVTVSPSGSLAAVDPNPADLLSAGHSCAKGLGLAAIDNDPDRLRTPLIKRNGRFEPAGWDEAFDEIARRLPPLLAEDRNAVAIYTGNPASFNLDHQLYQGTLLVSLGTRNVYSPSMLDTMPKHYTLAALFGTGMSFPVPDIDRTRLLVILGSNPLVSNGSTMSAPGMAGRLRALQERGGRFVVVDPAATRTARAADLHIPILPGADACFLLGTLSVIVRENLVDLGRAADFVDGLDTIRELAKRYPPEVVAPVCGVDEHTITTLARDIATSEAAAVHGRIGTCTQEFGTLASWLVDVLNIVTGNLDREGGVMFTLPPAGGPTTWPASRKGWPHGRWKSRVRGHPEMVGEFPAACLAEEIDTEGPGRIRALITVAGNPARSVPNSARLEKALGTLDFMISVDAYLNETTRHADVLLPPPRLATRGQMGLTTNLYSVRNVARYSAPVTEHGPHEMPEWQTILRLAAIARGESTRPIGELDHEAAVSAARRAAKLTGRDVDQVLAAVEPRTGPERLLDMRVRSGPYGDRFGQVPGGLTLADLEAAPDGIDFGPLRPRLPEVLRTPNGRIQLAPEELVADLARLDEGLTRRRTGLVLINRRQVRTLNSWLHNALPQPDAGHYALFVNPRDAAARSLSDGDLARVRTNAGEVTVEVRTTTEVREGVVSLPHGWGHDGGSLGVPAAEAVPGANVNLLVDDVFLEPLTGTAVLNGFPVEVEPA
ncbi:molybdopterin-dependent oxidoreductase [Amycolatopsis acidicola]|uniref:Molybdopterin-dependent oxidoreductase n=1 Tax=Amycolatopsis acidicola TaxID=2596893 RepID=A0A5N0V4W3_9PSEU|nr:molybdopterin-dependent oxidoreductase [Amycolatopsis acidicola]KAA9159099.1 molybdopterin-dependent oxidoreductase [Amycolatopsis acidicola]